MLTANQWVREHAGAAAIILGAQGRKPADGASKLLMQQLAAACEAIAGTTKKTEKTRLVADYFRAHAPEEAAIAAVFLSGRPFPAYEESTLQVGGSLLWQVIQELSGKGEPAMVAAYRNHGDLGATAYDVLRSVAPAESTLQLTDVEQAFRRVAGTRGPAAKASVVRELLTRATALEAKYLVKIMTGELRIGLKESLVEEAVARAFEATPAQVQRANMLLGDIGETLRLTATHRLAEARLRMFHPIGFMLASPVDTASEAFEFFRHAQVEDKYDGIRAQAHSSQGQVRLFSRTLDEVTGSFPELVEPLQAFTGDVILDGEIVAWDFPALSPGRREGQERGTGAPGRALPFAELQKRLGRKTVSPAMMRSVPVAYVVFDVLYGDGELVIDRPLHERAELLEKIFARAHRRAIARTPDPQGRLAFEPAVEIDPHAPVIRAPRLRADSPQHLAELFEAALARGNEGLMIKDVESPYTPGRRGRSWLKLKRELATLDVVVTSAEYGHGKRAGVLSDVTFAVRAGDKLLNVGKAYSGLTDAEIAELTHWFLEHTVGDHGFWREVEPQIVLEVAFNAVMRSDRHNSGYALRFPRILRIREDKLPEDIDTLERVEEIHGKQKLPQTA